MGAVCRITADVFERSSGVPQRLIELGAEVTLERLRVGDYLVSGGVVVERKTVQDLVLTLRAGRFWRQIGQLRQVEGLACLVVEGADQLQPPGARAALLAVSDLRCLVLRTIDARDTAAWLVALAARRTRPPGHRVRPAYAQRTKPTAPSVAEAMLAAVPGISTVGARALLGAFGSVTNVVAAPDDALLAVPGIGRRKVEALRKAVV